MRELTPEEEAMVLAFVQGAKWWEYVNSGATMWPSDQEAAAAAAIELLEVGCLRVIVADEAPGIYGPDGRPISRSEVGS